MIISEQWLRDWVSVGLTSQEIADCLTNAGLEVDAVQPLAGEIDHLVVGKVLSVSKHPDADRLNLTQVDIGSEILDIVCGASNVAQDLLVAVATVGAKLPNGLKIKRAKVRGIESNGMLCSASELGLEESSDGILELGADAELGQRIDEYLQLDDHLIDIDLTPNRGDCLSIHGIARELKVLAAGTLHPLDISDIEVTSQDTIEVGLTAEQACPKYLTRVISGIDHSASTPIWMAERLRRCGVRPISPVVDVTNYVMIELGQPMHAFDRNKLNGKISVRAAQEGEKIDLLDDSEASLKADTLVIADDQGPIAIAGVMGGANSAIDLESSCIVLEAAHFSKRHSAGRARKYGLHTESSHRFERGVDPLLPEAAIERATELIVEICGGLVGPVCTANAKDRLTSKAAVDIRFARLQQMLGMSLDKAEVEGILKRVSEQTVATNEGWSVSPPSYRFDIECEADLVEEVARVMGYDNIPTALPRIAPRSIAGSEAGVDLRRVRNLLVSRDFNEAITYSFISPEEQAIFSEEPPVVLSNPLAENMAVMRTSLLPGLLAALKYNSNRQHDRIRLFEIGASYHKAAEDYTEKQTLAAVISGQRDAPQWSSNATQQFDFFDLKADLEAVLSLTGKKELFIFNALEHTSLHPGQVAAIYLDDPELGKSQVGYIGRLHPQLEKKYAGQNKAFVFEIEIDKALSLRLPTFKSVSKFPSVKRDLSLVVSQEIPTGDIQALINEQLGDSLESSTLFDVYQGDGVNLGQKSVSLSLVLQHKERTMTDEEAEQAVQTVLSALNETFSAELRS